MPNLGIYIHIPFCGNKCSYCDFYSLSGQREPLMNDYIKALARHMEETGRFVGKNSKAGIAVDSVYFGGGTPSVLGHKRLCALLKEVKKNFTLTNKCEITVETNPGTVDARSLKKLYKAGFNRISFGVQAVQTELLSALGRTHTAEQAADAVREAAAAGFYNINVDVMYGIPGQTRAQLTETLRTVCAWQIRHLSLYGLKLEPGTPLHEAGPVLPGEDEQAEMYLAAVELLDHEGLKQYEVSNFARQGYLCRHNYKYWTLEPYIGFGAAAHSDFGNKRYGYIKDVQSYIDGVRDEDSLMDEMQQVPIAERAGEYVMTGLRTTNGISGNEYTRLFRASFDTLEEKLMRCAKWGLAEAEGDRWHLTPKGFLVSNQIIGELLDTSKTAESVSRQAEIETAATPAVT
jgi:oxygen-independent coproporphyrinogen-3 oxidase